MGQISTPPYTVAPLDLSDSGLAGICALVNRASGSDSLTPQYLRWQYVDNPAGQAVGYNALAGDRMVAHYATIPVCAAIHGAETRGLLSINTATDPAHAGKGLFTQLAAQTYEAGREHGFAYVIGVANDNSVYGFTRKLGFEAMGKLQTRFVCGSLAYRAGTREADLVPVWKPDALRWRLSNPKARYYAQASRLGALVYGSSSRFQVLLHEAEDRRVLGFAPPLPSRFRFNPLKMWLGLDNTIDWSRTLNVPVPSRFKATALNLIYRELQPMGAINKQSLSFWAIDFDSY